MRRLCSYDCLKSLWDSLPQKGRCSLRSGVLLLVVLVVLLLLRLLRLLRLLLLLLVLVLLLVLLLVVVSLLRVADPCNLDS